jgi:hypothetical protein
MREMKKGSTAVIYQYRPLGFDAKLDKKSNNPVS